MWVYMVGGTLITNVFILRSRYLVWGVRLMLDLCKIWNAGFLLFILKKIFGLIFARKSQSEWFLPRQKTLYYSYDLSFRKSCHTNVRIILKEDRWKKDKWRTVSVTICNQVQQEFLVSTYIFIMARKYHQASAPYQAYVLSNARVALSTKACNRQ